MTSTKFLARISLKSALVASVFFLVTADAKSADAPKGKVVFSNPKFLDGAALKQFDYVVAKGQGDAVVHIGSNALASVTIRMPSIDEQTAIAQVVIDMDNEIAALKAKLAKARDIKQGMMQQLLTGKIRLV